MSAAAAKADTGRQESLFAVRQVEREGERVETAGFSYRGSAAEVDDGFINDVLKKHLSFYQGTGGLWEQLHLAGATDEQIVASLPQMFSTGGGHSLNIQHGGESPALVYRSQLEELFTLSASELGERLRSLFSIPHPKPAEEVERARSVRLEEEREKARGEAELFIGRILQREKKGGECFARVIARNLYAEDCLSREGERRAAEAVYQELSSRAFDAPEAMRAAADIIHHAEITWRSVEERWGKAQPQRTAFQPARKEHRSGDLFAAEVDK